MDFPSHSGAPDKIQLEQLQSWTEHPNAGVKYFSGTATYHQTVNVPAEWFQKNDKLMLDLGQVMDIAEVTVNGQELGIGWKPPYSYDITEVLKPGANQLCIRVTNQWTNRLVGDRDPEIKQKVLPAGSENILFFGGPPPLQASGLLGPVTISAIKRNE